MSINVSDDDQCLTPPTVPFPDPVSFWAGKDVTVCYSCCEIFSTKIKNRKFDVLDIEHSLSGPSVGTYQLF